MLKIFVIFNPTLEFYLCRGGSIPPLKQLYCLLTPSCFWFMLIWSEELSHMLYAAADMVFVPSMYEPCGLAQMIGMRYGAVCTSKWFAPILKFIQLIVITVVHYTFTTHFMISCNLHQWLNFINIQLYCLCACHTILLINSFVLVSSNGWLGIVHS